MSICSSNEDLWAEVVEDDEFVMHIEEIKKTDQEKILKAGKKPLTVDDFEILGFLGEGAYAKVMQAKNKTSGKVFALKVILKKHVKKVFCIQK